MQFEGLDDDADVRRQSGVKMPSSFFFSAQAVAHVCAIQSCDRLIRKYLTLTHPVWRGWFGQKWLQGCRMFTRVLRSTSKVGVCEKRGR